VLGKEPRKEGLATSNEEGKTYIPSSLEPCTPPVCAPNDGRAHMRPTPTTWYEAAAIIRGARVRAPWPCTPPECAPRCHLRPHCRTRPYGRAHPSLPCVPHVRAFLTHAHPCAPLPYAPPEYKFHKLVIHSTTWASGPSTTKRWLIVGCLGGDHSFYIHSHSYAQRCACMHITFHVFFFVFIINACQLGGHIKLLASLYTF
jgi:hypothetical protein